MQHQLTTWYFDDRSDPRAILMVQIPGTRAENRWKTPGVAQGMFMLGIDRCMILLYISMNKLTIS